MVENVISGLVAHIDSLFLIMARVTGIMVMAPVFNNRSFPNMTKIGLSFFTALIILLTIPENGLAKQQNDLLSFALIVAQEVLLGISIGFVLQLVFAAILTAGQVIDMQMGFGIVNVIDPMWGTQVPMTGLILQLLALLIFIIYDGHLLVVKVLAESFRIIPVGGGPFSVAVSGELTEYMLRLFTGMFLTGIQLAMPIIGVILINDLALGIVARTVPQLNIFVVGIPLKIVVGVAFLWLILPLYIEGLNRLFAISFSNTTDFLRILVR